MNLHPGETKDHVGVWTSIHLSFQAYELSEDGRYVCFTCPEDNPHCLYRNAFPTADLFPGATLNITLQRRKNVTVQVQVPRDSDRFFSAQYGQDWRTPKRHWKGNDPSELHKRFDEHCIVEKIK